jgi:RNase P/RNase MRP subunit POP5
VKRNTWRKDRGFVRYKIIKKNFNNQYESDQQSVITSSRGCVNGEPGGGEAEPWVEEFLDKSDISEQSAYASEHEV